MSDDTYTVSATDVKTVAIPSSNAGRPAAPNPLLEIVKPYTKARDKAGTFTVAYGTDEAYDARRKAIMRDLSRAGQALNVSVRRTIAHDEMAKSFTVTFWVIDKVVRKTDETIKESADK